MPKTPLTDFAALIDKIHKTPKLVPIKATIDSQVMGLFTSVMI
ncbi:hypothetical protein RV17_GL002338 [Enterococcus thailandicus]|nr:hypothetical protein RV17_GL002338 [Enterococcus thailandicus]